MRFVLSVLSLVLLTATCWAGDTSRVHVHGFTSDGNFFVFEEYGISDGIGAPYASVFAIDTRTDRWVSGSPARVKTGEDGAIEGDESAFLAALDETREQAMAQADPFLYPLGRLGFGEKRAASAVWQLSGAPHFMRFSARSLLPDDGRAHRLVLEEKEYAANEKCFGFSKKMYGFRLRLTDEATGDFKILNDDDGIPASRPCPLGYRLEEVWTHDRADGQTVFAVLVRYSTIGFEGPDRRVIAVTGTLR